VIPKAQLLPHCAGNLCERFHPYSIRRCTWGLPEKPQNRLKRSCGEQLSAKPPEANLFPTSLPVAIRLATRGNKIMRANGYAGQEYLGIYPYVSKDPMQGSSEDRLWINASSTCYVLFEKWLDGNEPYERG
jgi:hypothetical protein